MNMKLELDDSLVFFVNWFLLLRVVGYNGRWLGSLDMEFLSLLIQLLYCILDEDFYKYFEIFRSVSVGNCLDRFE